MFGSRPSRSMGQTEWASDQQTITSNEIAETLLSVNKEREGLRRFFNLQLVQISLDTFMCICVWPVLWKTNISWYIRGSAYRFDSRHEQYFFFMMMVECRAAAQASASVDLSAKYKARGSEAIENAKHEAWGSKASWRAGMSAANVGASTSCVRCKQLLTYHVQLSQ